MTSGLILLNKPAGLTSSDCVNALKRSLGTRDIGHGGTLDKFAVGVLPILVGEGLKIARFFLEAPNTIPTYWKTYRATLKLGETTDTLDPSGQITERRQVPMILNALEIQAMAGARFSSYDQMPPRFSAKKIGGERASDLARKGENTPLKSVAVQIRDLEILEAVGDRIRFQATVSKGTYIRVLGADLAEAIGTVGHLTALSRTAVGPFRLEDTSTLDEPKLIPLKEAVEFLLPILVSPEEAEEIWRGQTAALLGTVGRFSQPSIYCAKLANGHPVALAERTLDGRAEFLRAFVRPLT